MEDVSPIFREAGGTTSAGRYTQTDVFDSLQENHIFGDQDVAATSIGDAWTEMARRQESMGEGSPFVVESRDVSRFALWSERPSWSFCLFLSLQTWYRSWFKRLRDRNKLTADYTEQGELFERLTEECLVAIGWVTRRTGWSPGQPAGIKIVVQAVAEELGEPQIQDALEDWITEHANEEGLDLVCYDPFPDGRGGRPLYFFQCASGGNWHDKLQTPDPDLWRRIISFTTIPQRGFSIPFALHSKEFRQKSGRVNGMMLDRYRLLCPAFYCDGKWESQGLSRDLLKWLRPRVRLLPTADQ